MQLGFFNFSVGALRFFGDEDFIDAVVVVIHDLKLHVAIRDDLGFFWEISEEIDNETAERFVKIFALFGKRVGDLKILFKFFDRQQSVDEP